MTVAHFHNPRALARAALYAAPLQAVLDEEGFRAAYREIASWPDYAPTPFLALDRTASALGIERLFYKDEAPRFGLNSFKALGGAYAVFRLLADKIAAAGEGPVTAAALAEGRWRHLTESMTVTCATDGNHGRSVAWGARLFHCRCVIFIHATVSEGRAAAIAAYDAEIVRLQGGYDESVHRAASVAAAKGWTVISDTAYAGYSAIPRQIMQGYGVVAEEIFAQLPGQAPPTHVFLQAGVGGMAASISARFWQHFAAARPRLIVVEPDRAACLYESARAGKPVVLTGDLDTVMAGLSCGEVSALAWPVLAAGAEDFMIVGDDLAIDTVRFLADGAGGDAPLVAGETGVAGLAGLRAAAADPDLRKALALGKASRVLVIGSEGDTDPAIYRRIVGRSAAEVRAAAR
ncbi:MAG TPA: diaminopropionate ammonia-lyase [Stellaceae bacterium]|jgi:diaminopropionate ammonia-lyase|nr:diaminopropionate ammonia-lyase [Stellaceae bacterium]